MVYIYLSNLTSVTFLLYWYFAIILECNSVLDGHPLSLTFLFPVILSVLRSSAQGKATYLVSSSNGCKLNLAIKVNNERRINNNSDSLLRVRNCFGAGESLEGEVKSI